MKVYESKDIRNVGIVGHGHSGKTSLVAGLLFTSGAVNRLTRVDEGNTPTDYDDEEIQRNVEASTAALKRALPAFLRPGIRIYPKKDVPLFWADEDNPKDGVIRKLNGKIERGVVDEDGNFKVTD